MANFMPASHVGVPQVIKYESVIHEFDPYFNFRVTQVRLPGSISSSSVLEHAELSSQLLGTPAPVDGSHLISQRRGQMHVSRPNLAQARTGVLAAVLGACPRQNDSFR